MTRMSPLLEVTNDAGRLFRVRVVMQGDRYGRDDCLIHEDMQPMVEWYDGAASVDKFGPRGQFVSRYFLTTLAGVGPCSSPLTGPLALDGGVAVWRVSAQNVRDAVCFAIMELARWGSCWGFSMGGTRKA